MSDNSKIEWTEATWNPISGCTKVSPGCDHCYAERLTERFHGPGSFAQVTLHPDRLDQPLHWRKPRRIFVNSMSDLFHDDVPFEFIAQVWAVMAMTPRHTFQILSKRHGRMRSLLSSEAFVTAVFDALWKLRGGSARRVGAPYPLPNVWLGVSVEDQKRADLRIPSLLDTPAAVRFLSCEPLLGPIDLDQWLYSEESHDGGTHRIHRTTGIDWVIAGGESGPGARPMHPDWARSLRDQCTGAGVPFLFKQWGEWAPAGHGVRFGLPADREWRNGKEHWFPGHAEDEVRLTHTVMRRVGKHAAGRVLDGRTWDKYPAGTS